MRIGMTILLAVALAGCGDSKDNDNGNNNGGKDQGVTTDGGVTNSPDLKTPGSTTGCNVAQQTGCGTGEKCVVVGDEDGAPTDDTTCASVGDKTNGQGCTWDEDNTWNDDCDKGLTCDTQGGDSSTTCRKICTKNADCDSTERCFNFYGLDWGQCVKTCTPFGTDCPAQNDCGGGYIDIESTDDTFSGGFYCKPTGEGAAGDECQYDSDCGANLACFGTCTATCDGTHACPGDGGDGGTAVECQAFTNANGAGFCLEQ